MQISEKHLKEFMKIYKDKYEKEISRAEALESAQRLVNFIEVIIKGHIRKRLNDK